MGRLPQAVAGVTLLAILSGCSILLRQPAQPKFPNYPKNDLERMARAVGACFCVCSFVFFFACVFVRVRAVCAV